MVVSNSLLHHLHDPFHFWKATKNLAGKNCFMFHRDLRRPSTEQMALALQRKHLAEAPSILIRDFLASMRAAFTVREVCRQLKLESLHNLQVIEIDDRYLEVMGIY